MPWELFRSQPMTRCQIILPPEAAYHCVMELGEVGYAEFIDMTPTFGIGHRRFFNEVKRLTDMESKLVYLTTEMEREDVDIDEWDDENIKNPEEQEMFELETLLEKLEGDVRSTNSFVDLMNHRYFDLVERKQVIACVEDFYNETTAIHLADMASDIELGPMSTPALEEEEDLVGARTGPQVQKIRFGATLIDIPEKAAEREFMAKQADQRIQDYVLYHSHERKLQMLEQCATYIELWMGKIRKMKGVFACMNQFNYDIARQALVGECWIPDKYIKKCTDAMNRGLERSYCAVQVIVSEVAPGEEPPTFHEVNKFTRNFQVIIDAYGIANYREVNPAPFAIVTFPFLFSLMFGDAGHAMLMCAGALAFIKFEDKLNRARKLNEITRMFFNGRYIVLMMGLFSIYSGFMYNDFMSKPINICGSSWFPNRVKFDLKTVLNRNPILSLNPNIGADYTGYPYPFGMDPVWSLAENKIAWLNTYKMKMAIIFGVSQMMYGNIMALLNHVYFGDVVSIFCEFLPMVLYLGCLFGYLAVLIVAKFILYGAENCHCAPALLITLIDMFLGVMGGTRACSTAHFYDGQGMVETVLALIIIACIFWILLPKPFILLALHKRKLKRIEAGEPPEEYDRNKHVRYGEHPFTFGDAFIHQCIHMIEYCLGCISHTASYLRLWALSLAHAQLSEVIWTYLMNYPFTASVGAIPRFILVFCGWAAWAALTVAIMLLMEGLSAFLHTLRLHWVEFQSKFYRGDGRKFKPFSFVVIMHPDV